MSGGKSFKEQEDFNRRIRNERNGCQTLSNPKSGGRGVGGQRGGPDRAAVNAKDNGLM